MNLKVNIQLLILLAISGTLTTLAGKISWKNVEKIAEEHPYIVAILDEKQEVQCTGSIIREKTVLTSAKCVDPKPFYVTIRMAVIWTSNNRKNLLQVANTMTHRDFIFDGGSDNRNNFMHSNLGLVFTVSLIRNYNIDAVAPGNLFATELTNKDLTALGYGLSNGSNGVMLQQEFYVQRPCINPKWYYVICGNKNVYDISNVHIFGQGGPVLFDNNIVGVSAFDNGRLQISKSGTYFNVFTVIAPYSLWILNSEKVRKEEKNYIVQLSSNAKTPQCDLFYVKLLTVISFYWDEIKNFIN